MTEDRNASMVWRHAQPRKHVWCSAGREIRMAEEYSPLEGHPREHPRPVGTVPIHFVIADGIVVMEGNGPLMAPPVLSDGLCLRMIW